MDYYSGFDDRYWSGMQPDMTTAPSNRTMQRDRLHYGTMPGMPQGAMPGMTQDMPQGMPGMMPGMPQGMQQGMMQGEETSLSSALSLILDALAGETADKLYYNYLISKAPDAVDVQLITGIRDDEMKHYAMFRRLYYELTGAYPPPAPEEPFEPPASYCEGLKNGVLGEQHAVAKYRNILFAMQQRRHINMMTEIITDELRHLGLYNYMYAKNGCKA